MKRGAINISFLRNDERWGKQNSVTNGSKPVGLKALVVRQTNIWPR